MRKNFYPTIRIGKLDWHKMITNIDDKAFKKTRINDCMIYEFPDRSFITVNDAGTCAVVVAKELYFIHS